MQDLESLKIKLVLRFFTIEFATYWLFKQRHNPRYRKQVRAFFSAGRVKIARRSSGVSAVIRALPAQQPLLTSISAISHYVDEVVICLNAEESDIDWAMLKRSVRTGTDIKVTWYPEALASAGNTYQIELKSGKGSLAKFYNWAFSQAKHDTVLKWDDDMIPTGDCAISQLGGSDAVWFDGCDVLGVLSTRNEPRLFRLRRGVRFFDGDDCERIALGKHSKTYLKGQKYVHLKRLKPICEHVWLAT